MLFFFFFSSRRRHTRCLSDWSSDVCSSDLGKPRAGLRLAPRARHDALVLRRVRADWVRDRDGQLRNVDRPDGHGAGREPRGRGTREDGPRLRAGSGEGLRSRLMKLVTFNSGQVGELRDGTVVELDVPSMREYFGRSQHADPTGAEYALD